MEILLWTILGCLSLGRFGEFASFTGLVIGACVGIAFNNREKKRMKSLQEELSELRTILNQLKKKILIEEETLSLKSSHLSDKTAPNKTITASAAAKKETLSLTTESLSLKTATKPVPSIQRDLVRDNTSANFSTQPTQKTPQGPSIDPIIAAIQNFFTGGNLFVRLGVIILFFGVSFLLKFAADQGYFPVEFRLIAIAIGSLILIILGWRLRIKRAAYALTLQGGGIGLFYLTVFGAYRLFHLIPPELAFALLIAIVLCSVILAVGQNAAILAIMGTSGGFLAPILASSGSGNHVGLFTFYTILNLGIFAIAWRKSWRTLNLLGAAFTFSIGSLWGASYYKPELFSTTEPFLIFFFILYAIIPMLFATRQQPKLKGFIDGTLVFGVPVVVMSLQSALVHDFEYGLAWSALGFAAFYIGSATLLFRHASQMLRQLVECELAIGIVFATLTVPLALGTRWTGAVWALEGAALVWIGLRQNRTIAQIFGAGLVLTACLWTEDWQGASYAALSEFPTFANAFYVSSLLRAGGALLAAFLFHKRSHLPKITESAITTTLAVTGLAWWYFGALSEIRFRFAFPNADWISTTFILISLALSLFAAHKAKWDVFADIGVAAAALGTAFGLGEAWRNMAWAVEGAITVHNGLRCRRSITTWLGNALLAFAGGFMVWALFLQQIDFTPSPLLNLRFVHNITISLAILSAAFFYSRHTLQQSTEASSVSSKVLLFCGTALWLASGNLELNFFAPDEPRRFWMQMLTIASFFLAEALRTRLKWQDLKWAALATLPAGFLFLAIQLTDTSHPLVGWGLAAWPITLAAHFGILWRHEGEKDFAITFTHAAGLWLIVTLAAWETSWLALHWLPESPTWSLVAWNFVPTLALVAIASGYKRVSWPLARHGQTYMTWGLVPIAAVVFAKIFIINFQTDGDPTPLAYLPFLNPLDLTIAFGLMSILKLIYTLNQDFPGVVMPKLRFSAYRALSITLFTWCTALLLRTLHFYADIPFTYHAMYDSITVQTALSIFWSLYALTVMVIATRNHHRYAWLTGAALLGCVISKLFTVDLSNRGTAMRIVSFIGVGVLLLIIGYFAPLPPRSEMKERT